MAQHNEPSFLNRVEALYFPLILSVGLSVIQGLMTHSFTNFYSWFCSIFESLIIVESILQFVQVAFDKESNGTISRKYFSKLITIFVLSVLGFISFNPLILIPVLIVFLLD